MTFSRSLLTCLAFSTATTIAFAAAPATNSATAATPPAKKEAAPKDKGAAPAPAEAASPAPQAAAPFSLNDYIKDLTDELKLSDTEKKEIETYYVNDGPQLQTILNDDTISPLQQAQQVAAIRDARNAKIEMLLNDWRRQNEFLKIEAGYRVALTELAANGGLIATTAHAAK
ncbi:MAG: hypothetical protein LV480_13760 [Methylacidiphilales bacterium]|nr:hypothetical protein [Candidatus Methylacidiphilales bacterium]